MSPVLSKSTITVPFFAKCLFLGVTGQLPLLDQNSTVRIDFFSVPQEEVEALASGSSLPGLLRKKIYKWYPLRHPVGARATLLSSTLLGCQLRLTQWYCALPAQEAARPKAPWSTQGRRASSEQLRRV